MRELSGQSWVGVTVFQARKGPVCISFIRYFNLHTLFVTSPAVSIILLQLLARSTQVVQ